MHAHPAQVYHVRAEHASTYSLKSQGWRAHGHADNAYARGGHTSDTRKQSASSCRTCSRDAALALSFLPVMRRVHLGAWQERQQHRLSSTASHATCHPIVLRLHWPMLYICALISAVMKTRRYPGALARSRARVHDRNRACGELVRSRRQHADAADNRQGPRLRNWSLSSHLRCPQQASLDQSISRERGRPHGPLFFIYTVLVCMKTIYTGSVWIEFGCGLGG